MELIIKIVLAVIFGLAAIAKFSGKTKATFEKAGYSRIFMYATALAEVLFSIGLFTPYDLLAVLGLIAIIAGAIVTLIQQQVPPVKYGMAALSFILLSTLLVLIADRMGVIPTVLFNALP
jgi:urea transporter